MPRSSLGSVKPDGKGVWRVRADLGRDPVTGKRVQREKRVRGSKREAESVLARMLAESGRIPTAGARMTLSDYVESVYIPSARARLREDTVQGYRSSLDTNILPALGRVPLADIDAAMVDAMLSRVAKPGARRRAYVTLRQVLRHAQRRRLLSWVATDAVECPAVPRYEPRVLDEAEAARVLSAFRGDPVEFAVLMALGCGLRRSEICGLDWEDIDIQARAVHVHDPVVYVHGKECRNGTKTANSLRYVSLPESFAARLAEIMPPAAHGPCLPGPHSGRIHPDALSARYDASARAAGVRYTCLKDLRHSHATIMLAAGVDVVTVSRRLGHSSVSVTDRFYLRPRRAQDEGAAAAFDALDLCPQLPTNTDVCEGVQGAAPTDAPQVN